MRALLALVVLAVAAPTAANACAMRMERKAVNLAELMDEVDDEKEEPALANVVVVEKPAVEVKPEVQVDKADLKTETEEPAPVVKPQS